MPQLYGKEGEDRKMGERNCRNLSDIGRYWPASLITARSSLKPSRGAPAYDLTLTEVKHRNDMWEKAASRKGDTRAFQPTTLCTGCEGARRPCVVHEEVLREPAE